jgi:hypothetical protein
MQIIFYLKGFIAEVRINYVRKLRLAYCDVDFKKKEDAKSKWMRVKMIYLVD